MNKENITDNKVKDVIDIIKDMDVKNKLRLGVCMSSSAYTNLKYNKATLVILLAKVYKENYNKFDSMLKDIDEEYRTTIINFSKYKLVMFVMAKLMKMETIEQNKVALYLFNDIYNKVKI